MKIKIVIYLAASCLITGCLKDPEINAFQLGLHIDFSDEVSVDLSAGAKVKLKNLQKDYVIETTTNGQGDVQFSNLEPGFYSATMTHSYNDGGEFFYLNGYSEVDVFDNLIDTVPVVLSKTSVFLIKEYYYSACLTPAGNQYSSDQYIEIYNNTPELQYADKLSIVEHESYGTDQNYWSFLEDTIVVKMIWTIPGNGQDVPVLPGESVILARDAFNHRDDPNGNPLCPVNLGNAEFEFFVSSGSANDTDNPYSANLIEDLFVFRGSDVVFHTRGGSAIALVKLAASDEERNAFINAHLIPKESASGTSSRYFCKIPNAMVMDAVEATWDEAHAIYKRFPLELDAGYTYVAAGSRSGKCLRRKVKEVVDGRVVYMDTNNSTEDFIKDADPMPKIYE